MAAYQVLPSEESIAGMVKCYSDAGLLDEEEQVRG